MTRMGCVCACVYARTLAQGELGWTAVQELVSRDV